MKPKSRLADLTTTIRRLRRLIAELTALTIAATGLVAIVLTWLR